jgi:hypothetical protein
MLPFFFIKSEGNMPILIPVERLVKVCNPLVNPPWDRKQRLLAINNRIKNKRFAKEPVGPWGDHAARIAWFVVSPPEDPIEIDVGIPSVCCHVDWIITDGNHRTAAAIYREDEYIPANVSGCVSYAYELFGVRI